ncbi:hypothetical protein [Deinococcus rubellus]|uniref:hypothetical protein n=1 Tax=Deinococcus rubellus TaxID=1889240 RepID=UPI003CD06F5D
MALLQDAQKGEKTVEKLCRALGCITASFCLWKKRYGDASIAEAKRRLGQNSAAGHACPLRRLERENDRLLRIVGVVCRAVSVQNGCGPDCEEQMVAGQKAA